MAWLPRTRAAIRDAYLADLQSRYVSAGQPLDIGAGSDAYRKAECLALLAESLEVQANNNTNEILPDTASEAGVIRHGFVEGVTRHQATKAVLHITVTGTASATVTFGSSRPTSPDGITFTASANADGTGASITLSGGGTGTAYATAQVAGIEGNLAVSTILTWSSTPTNANSTVTVAAISVTAVDQESKDAWAQRIIAHRQDRPGSGNESDLYTWATDCAGVFDACIYPLTDPAYGYPTRGAATLVLLGQVQGTSATNTRIVSGSVVTLVSNYVEGLGDANGGTTDLKQLRPAGLYSTGYGFRASAANTQDVTITLTMAASDLFPWTSATSYTVTAWNNTTKVATLSASPTLVTVGATVGLRDTGVRGTYSYGKITAVNLGANTVTFESTFAPVTVDVSTGKLRPAPQSASAIVSKIFAFFDSLGPGDSNGVRFPPTGKRMPAILYLQALAASVITPNVPAVLSALVSVPATDITPADFTIVTLGTLILSH